MIEFKELETGKETKGLVPAIIQDDATLTVLMLGYMDEAALAKTQAEGKVTFYSRSKGRLWTKGETSGNYLNLVSISKDCDSDALLIRVNPVGPTCHTGTRSCFASDNARAAVAAGEKEKCPEGFIRELERVIQQRHRDMPEGSYTARLFNKGVNKIAQKVGEEAVETVIEAVALNHERLIYEASDLVYHLLVLLEATGHSIADLERELERRHA